MTHEKAILFHSLCLLQSLTVFTSKHFVINEHHKQMQSFCKLKNRNLIYLDEIPTNFITTLYHKDCYATDVLTCMHTHTHASTRARVHTHTHTHTKPNTSFIIGTIYANGIVTHFWQI